MSDFTIPRQVRDHAALLTQEEGSLFPHLCFGTTLLLPVASWLESLRRVLPLVGLLPESSRRVLPQVLPESFPHVPLRVLPMSGWNPVLELL